MSFRAAGDRVVEGVAAGLYAAGTELMARSQPLVPVETGTLKRSGEVEQPVHEGDAVSVTVGYAYGVEYEEKASESGDGGPGYAIYVHERLDLHHPHGQAKFLQAPAEEFAPEFPGVVARVVAERSGG